MSTEVKTVAWHIVTEENACLVSHKTVAWLWWDANATGIDTGGKHGRYKVSDLDPTDIRAFAVVARSDLESAEARAQRAEQALRELVAVKALKWEFEGLALGGFRAEVASGAIQYEPKHARYTALKAEYDRRQPLAWAAARAIVDGEQT